MPAGKLTSEQKPIVLPCLHSPPCLIGTQSHSAKFLNWGDHVNSVPDVAASPVKCSFNCIMDMKRHCSVLKVLSKTTPILRATFVGLKISVPTVMDGSRGGQSEPTMNDEKFRFISI